MEELLELKDLIVKKDYQSALALVEEMEEMSREDKINKIKSFIKIILVHLIKQAAEQRTTRSGDISIRSSLISLCDTNKRRKSGGYYAARDELAELIESAFSIALDFASLEAFGGSYDSRQIAEKIDANTIKKKALQLVLDAQRM